MTWSQVLEGGYGEAAFAVSFFSQPDMQERETSYLAFVDATGNARIIKAGYTKLGWVAARGTRRSKSHPGPE